MKKKDEGLEEVKASVDQEAMQKSSLSEEDEAKLIKQAKNEYYLAKTFMQPRIDKWLKGLKLYNNQKRDQKAVGDPLLFTILNALLASLYDDRINIEWEAREQGDLGVEEHLNIASEFDYEKMRKPELDYDWLWDALFFGYGLVNMTEFDRDERVPVPELLDPATFMYDPKAETVNGLGKRNKGGMRFLGNEVLLTKNQMKEIPGFFNLDKVRAAKSKKDLPQEAAKRRQEALGGQQELDIHNLDLGESTQFKAVDWRTWFNGERVLTTFTNDMEVLNRYQVLKGNGWGIIPKVVWRIAHQFQGVSVLDLVEDKQRMRSVVTNLGIKALKLDIYPMYAYDSSKVKNKGDLQFGFNKFIPVDGVPSNVITPIHKVAPNMQLYDYIMETLDGSSQRATACYSEDTQTLTEDGWKYYWEVEDGKKIATFNPDTENVEYHLPTKKLIYDYKGKMYYYHTSKGVDLMVTPDHKIWHRADSGNGKHGDWKLSPANKIEQKRIEFMITAGWDGEEEEFIEIDEVSYKRQTQYNGKEYKFKLDDWLEFVGYIVSEGYMGELGNNKGGYRVQLTQKEGEDADKIRSCLKRLGVSFKEYMSKGDGCKVFLVYNKTLWCWLRKHVGDYSYNKRFPVMFRNLSQRQLRIFFDAYMLGDGHFPKREGDENNATATTTSSDLADDLQEIGLKLGYKTKVSYKEAKGNNLPKWRLHFVFMENREKDWATPRLDLETALTLEDYDGVVYCFQVPNHLFITRRNGLVSIQGNTPELQQGIISKEARTLGELNLVAQKVDTRYSLVVKSLMRGEKKFWRQWYFLYKNHFKNKIGAKWVRLAGVMSGQFRELTRENLIAKVDPDVKVESKLLSEAKQLKQLARYGQVLEYASADPTTNRRFALKKFAALSGLSRDEVDKLFPATLDEMMAKEQNEELNDNKQVPVLPDDNHLVHLEIHGEANPTDATYAHIETHKMALLLQRTNPEMFPNLQQPEEEQGLQPGQEGVLQGDQGRMEKQQHRENVTPAREAQKEVGDLQ